MKFIFVVINLFSFLAEAAPPAKTQWALRFNKPRPYSHAQTGCYGTASYAYIIPSIHYLKAYSDQLEQVATRYRMSGVIWSRTEVPNKFLHVYVWNLAKSRVETRSTFKLGPGPYGVVFCLCRHTHWKNCNRSGLDPLGNSYLFFANRNL